VKTLAFELDRELDNLFLVIGSECNGKAGLTISISKALAAEKSLNAGQMVRDLGKEIAGGGGGQAHFATAGGKNPAGIEKALELSRSYLD
jgi:alanyl-tRNA synthetase